ncbi:hypothetical protein ACE1CI_23225, partial [Aerosakkonemataceae cyanobacterium BLCC-F50]
PCLITEKFELIPVHTLLDVGTGRLYGYNPYPVRLLWLAIAHFVRNAGRCPPHKKAKNLVKWASCPPLFYFI